MAATPNKMITMSQEKYDELVEAYETLTALEAAGVDNWEGYSDAMEILNEERE